MKLKTTTAEIERWESQLTFEERSAQSLAVDDLKRLIHDCRALHALDTTEVAKRLSDGWHKYIECFGVQPRGTEKQMAALWGMSGLGKEGA